MRSARLFLLFAALLAAGCGDDEPPTQPSGSGGSPLQELYSEILSPGGATFYAFQSAYAGAARVTLINVTDASGEVTSWAVEFGSPYALLRKGLRKTDFPLGVPVAVKDYRARSGKAVANASSVLLADGRGFYTSAEDSPGVASATQ